jgi:hypothetical protein
LRKRLRREQELFSLHSICTTSRNASAVAQSSGEKNVLIENDVSTFSWGSSGKTFKTCYFVEDTRLRQLEAVHNFGLFAFLDPKDRGSAFM